MRGGAKVGTTVCIGRDRARVRQVICSGYSPSPTYLPASVRPNPATWLAQVSIIQAHMNIRKAENQEWKSLITSWVSLSITRIILALTSERVGTSRERKSFGDSIVLLLKGGGGEREAGEKEQKKKK